MRVGIVGAGISGLACARALHDAGAAVTVFEKSAGLGGRIATRRVDGFVFDTGATHLVPREPEIAAAMAAAPSPEFAPVAIPKPVYVHAYGRIAPGDPARNGHLRYAYRDGNTRLAKQLADGLEILRDHRVERIVRSENEQGEEFWVDERPFDALVLTAPVPQTELLLEQLGEARAISHVRYRPCLSVLFGYGVEVDRPFSALIDPEQRHPLTWLSLESSKVDGRAPAGGTAVVAQMSRAYSADWYAASDEHVLADVAGHVERLLGAGLGEPVVAQVKRWRYSQPEATAMFDSANPAGTRILVAGDGVAGGRVERAFAVGVRAARRLLESAP